MPAPRFFVLAAVGMGGFFAAWTFLVLRSEQIPAFDFACATFWYDQAHEHRLGFMVFFTDLGGTAAMTLLAIVGALWQASLKNRLLAIAWIVVAISGGLLNSATKQLIDRPRPPPEMRDKAVLQTNQSYPSGHSMGSAVGFGFLAYTLCLWQTCGWRRLLILIAAACVLAAIGFSRIYLRAHWFSDVIGGFSLGLTWLFLCLSFLERMRLKPVAA